MNDLARLATGVRDEPVPEGFADRVMAALPPEDPLWLRLWDRPWVQAVLWTAACVLLAIRIGSTFAMFFLG
jgi:hypothetical protein